jgi:plastocyanin
MRRFFAIAGVFAAGSLFAPTPARAGGGCHGSTQPSGSGTTVALAMNCMTPRVLHAPAGTTIRFVNNDPVTHNLVGDNWGVDELRPGKEYAHDFPPGVHAYSCTIHPGMVGAIVVGDLDGTPVALAASTPAQTSDSDRLPLGVALGAVVGIAATVVSRRLRRGPTRQARL